MTADGPPRRADGDAFLLVTSDVTKTFWVGGISVQAVRGVSLRLRRGEFAAIMGPSGSRKSTLPHLLGGPQRPSSGEIWLDRCRVRGLSQADWAVLRRRRIGGNRR